MDQLNNITLWDVKDVFNKVKNVVMNYTEMEAKVREATNNEPWGASSTLMQEIAQGTWNYTYFNEIMPTIYKRFSEKEARQWRQIYKALQLLEYLVKHGSERVVDDARAHMGTIKLLRNFSYIDEKGKDQGINVRNRARELAELLADIDKIRQERKKAKTNRTKFTGVGSDAVGYGGFSGSFNSGSFNGGSSRYGGFGNDSYSYSERSSSRYDDYDTQWQSDYRTGRVSPSDDRRSSFGNNNNRSSISSLKKASDSVTSNSNGSNGLQEPVEPQKEVNLFDFDDPPITSDTSNQIVSNDFDDDFQDFQSAPTLVPSSQRSSISLQSSNSIGLQNSTVSPIQPITNLKLVQQPISNVQPPANPGINNNLLDDLLGPTPQSTNLSINTPKPSSQPINAFNITKSISPTTPKQNATNIDTSFPNLKSNDIWASNLVSLDSLGKQSNNNNTKQSVKPSMNSLAQADSTSWAVKGTWAGAQPVQQPIQNTQLNSQQKQQDSFDLLM